MEYGESLGKINQLMVVSPRKDLIGSYIKKGYKEIQRIPLEDVFPPKYLKENGLQMILMQKINKAWDRNTLLQRISLSFSYHDPQYITAFEGHKQCIQCTFSTTTTK